jgi:phage shock protein C
MKKTLYRSKNDRMIFGVCGGIADYFTIDPVIIRLIAILLVFAHGTGLIAYIILAIIVPAEGSRNSSTDDTVKENVADIKETARDIGQQIHDSFAQQTTSDSVKPPRNKYGHVIIGFILIIFGVIYLLSSLNIIWWLNWNVLWPLIFVAIGVIIVAAALKR